MEFLKALFNDKALTFDEFVNAINAHNGNEANKDKMIKLANLSDGEYVSKLKYDDIVSQMTGKQTELDTANNLIAELKKGTKGNEELQGKITDYETQVADLKAQLQEAKISSALKVALMGEKCLDVPYLTFKVQEKLKEDGKTLELDGNENIKGWNDLISGFKTSLPNHFETGNGGRKVLGDNRLPNGDDHPSGITKEQFDKMGYQSRLKLKQEQPEVYNQMTGRTTN